MPLSYHLYSILENQKAVKNTFQATTFKVEENSRTFQGKVEFKDISRTLTKIQPCPSIVLKRKVF